MVFSSLTFLFFFLPITVGLYFVCKNRTYRNVILLLASLLFYSWGEPKYILLLLGAALVAYLGGLVIDKTDGRKKRVALTATVVLLVSNLLVFKYLNFAADNVNAIFPGAIKIGKIALPIGISFYTFQILSYVIDLYRKRIGLQRNYFYLLLYVSFFPQLIAGPIVRYQTVESEICHRTESVADVSAGLKRFIVGLAKKVILANNIALIAENVYAGNEAYGTAIYWLAAFAYALQIYFDFSGYSDMAIGLGRMFGFHFLENFNDPYSAISITDFWRRWHISLSTWFRDYIYIPLGGNRVKLPRYIINILVVWGLTGFWHGAEWNFLLWGLYYAILLLIEKLFLSRFLEKLPKGIRWFYSFFFILIGWVLFNRTDLTSLAESLKMMFSFRPTDWVGVICADATLPINLLYLIPGILCLLPIRKKLYFKGTTAQSVLSSCLYLGLFAACIIYILSSSYNPFIYFRF